MIATERHGIVLNTGSSSLKFAAYHPQPRARPLLAGAVLLALALCWPSAASADWAYTHWGMTPEQVAAASAGKVKVLPAARRTRDDYNHWEFAAEGTYTDGALTGPIGFAFDTQRGGLKCVMYNAMGDDAETLRVALLKRYGPPKSESSFATSHSLTWRTPDTIEFVAGQQPVAAAVIHCLPDTP